MAHAASYAPIADGDTTIAWGEDIDSTFKFDCPGVADDQQSVLVWVNNPAPDGDDADVRLSMSINGTDVADVAFTTGQGRPWQEIVQGGLLKETGNKLTAKLTDSDKSGSITLKDIVLYYKLAS
jgi:hypothetical protein